MAEVVSIVERLNRTGSAEKSPTGQAQILLFTGVRYERLDRDDHAPQGSTPQTSGRRKAK